MSGQMFETYVITEIIKSYSNRGLDYRYFVSYYRGKDKKKIKTGGGEIAVESEIDFIIEENGVLYPIEIKKGIGRDKANKNFRILEQYKMPIATGLVIDTSDSIFPLNKDTYYCPVGMIGI